MPTLHCIHGFLGSGKTTFSKSLAQELNALYLSNDLWMVQLFGHNPDKSAFDYYPALIDLQYDVARDVLNNGRDVILDHGFWRRDDRDRARRFCYDHAFDF